MPKAHNSVSYMPGTPNIVFLIRQGCQIFIPLALVHLGGAGQTAYTQDNSTCSSVGELQNEGLNNRAFA